MPSKRNRDQAYDANDERHHIVRKKRVLVNETNQKTVIDLTGDSEDEQLSRTNRTHSSAKSKRRLVSGHERKPISHEKRLREEAVKELAELKQKSASKTRTATVAKQTHSVTDHFRVTKRDNNQSTKATTKSHAPCRVTKHSSTNPQSSSRLSKHANKKLTPRQSSKRQAAAEAAKKEADQLRILFKPKRWEVEPGEGAKKFPFMQLPPEMRNRIYDLLVEEEGQDEFTMRKQAAAPPPKPGENVRRSTRAARIHYRFSKSSRGFTHTHGEIRQELLPMIRNVRRVRVPLDGLKDYMDDFHAPVDSNESVDKRFGGHVEPIWPDAPLPDGIDVLALTKMLDASPDLHMHLNAPDRREVLYEYTHEISVMKATIESYPQWKDLEKDAHIDP